MKSIEKQHIKISLLTSYISIETTKPNNVKGPSKKEQYIDGMSNEDVVIELKDKKLPTFGTGAERKERLKKHYGKITLVLICMIFMR
jgi:hypothetical protein